MKKIALFLLSFLVLVIISIFGTGNDAFARSPQTSQVAVLICSVTSPTATEPSTFRVTAFSPDTHTTVKIGDDCATDLTGFENKGFVIKDIQAVASSNAVSVVYTLGD